MKAGFENKNSVIALSVLGLLLAYVFYDNVLSGPLTSTPAIVKRTAKSPMASAFDSVPPVTSPRTASHVRTNASRAKGDVFLPPYLPTRPEDRINVTNVDPTLRLDLMAKVQAVPAAGSGRDLFSWGQAPPPPPTDPKGKGSTVPSDTIINRLPPQGDNSIVLSLPAPFNLKYYGICTYVDNGKRTSFFLEGDEILIATEGNMFSGRYRLLQINANWALVEDTQNKRRQSLPLADDARGEGLTQ